MLCKLKGRINIFISDCKIILIGNCQQNKCNPRKGDRLSEKLQLTAALCNEI